MTEFYEKILVQKSEERKAKLLQQARAAGFSDTESFIVDLKSKQPLLQPIELPEPDPIYNNGWFYVGKSVFGK